MRINKLVMPLQYLTKMELLSTRTSTPRWEARPHGEKTSRFQLSAPMLIILFIGRLLLLLTMSMVSEDVLWLEPLFFSSNFTMVETAFDYQISSLSLSSANTSSSSSSSAAALSSSSSSMPLLTVTVASVAQAISNQDRFLVLKWSVRIIGGLLIVIGGIGNTLSALTLSRKKLRAQVTSIYLIALALSDLGNVFFSVLNFYLVRLDPEQNMRLTSNIACKLHMFFTYYFLNLSPTLLVAVSVQRYLAIAKHHYSKRHCTVKNPYTVIALICLVWIFLQLHWGIFYELKRIPQQGRLALLNRTLRDRRVCNISKTYPAYLWFRSNMIGYIQWFLFTLCPFVIMLILNSLILQVVASARRIQQRINQKNQRKKAKQRNMTIMLLSVSCVFILLTAPASTFMAFGHLFKNLHGPNSQSLWTMFSLIYYANTAANFLLYFLTADVFRQELRVMMLSLPGCSKLLPRYDRNDGGNAAAAAAAIGDGRGGVGLAAITAMTVGNTRMTTLPLLPSDRSEVSRIKSTDHRQRNGKNASAADRTLLENESVDNPGDGSNDEDLPF